MDKMSETDQGKLRCCLLELEKCRDSILEQCGLQEQTQDDENQDEHIHQV